MDLGTDRWSQMQGQMSLLRSTSGAPFKVTRVVVNRSLVMTNLISSSNVVVTVKLASFRCCLGL